jgi:hypothetical protein
MFYLTFQIINTNCEVCRAVLGQGSGAGESSLIDGEHFYKYGEKGRLTNRGCR